MSRVRVDDEKSTSPTEYTGHGAARLKPLIQAADSRAQGLGWIHAKTPEADADLAASAATFIFLAGETPEPLGQTEPNVALESTKSKSLEVNGSLTGPCAAI